MPMPYTLVRSNRRTLALVVDPAGTLIARAPKRMSLRDIEAFVALKERWILKKQAAAKEREQSGQTPKLTEGVAIPFLGQTLILRIAEVPFAFSYAGTLLLPRKDSLSKSLLQWFRAVGEREWLPRVRHWERETGLRCQSVHFSTARTRWGSMTAQGALRLNLALMLCPPPVIDYVMVHELAHSKHHNHSPDFWALVEKLMPEFREHRNWLKRNNHLIRLLYPQDQTALQEGGPQ